MSLLEQMIVQVPVWRVLQEVDAMLELVRSGKLRRG